MAVAKKDQERANYAWMYGAQARKDGKERVVPEYWEEHAEAWLQGFDDVPLAGATTAKAVSGQMEAELDASAVDRDPK
ncbi:MULTISPECIES: hypothetical protein [unclassified Mesorhizobium]|uniref:hypothetical protein n=1 Tax=unclassified Mesorhizobium TaxID=325217 RepID=UPI001CCF0463|nr:MULTISPECIES: hypothetical protein [unclassified Mesorhizobium]MBZ9739801.1 hypothetical protein [Mesorhizobium sp. CO1-1-4]MBZ9739988.1 hypothetical protein [Mesorhizobium sp. CO1-1-4]MBZ9804935.1 hypothetical protein [Mesorhizobium sp. ES1-6]MBZ9806160.1 hypothetical protein [Mesorhizobium sp. ES1-6]